MIVPWPHTGHGSPTHSSVCCTDGAGADGWDADGAVAVEAEAVEAEAVEEGDEVMEAEVVAVFFEAVFFVFGWNPAGTESAFAFLFAAERFCGSGFGSSIAT